MTMRPDITVVGTIKSKSEEDDGIHLKLHVPTLTQFPIDVYKVPAEDAASLNPGMSHTIRLLRGGLRPDKDPSKDWNYKWLWGGFAEQTVDELPFDEPETPEGHRVTAPKPVDYGMADHPTKTAGFRMMRAMEMARWYAEQVIGGVRDGEPLSVEATLNIGQSYYEGIVAIEEGTRERTEG
jgi:hypothetical protein